MVAFKPETRLRDNSVVAPALFDRLIDRRRDSRTGNRADLENRPIGSHHSGEDSCDCAIDIAAWQGTSFLQGRDILRADGSISHTARAT
jgi:hypothetical protein